MRPTEIDAVIQRVMAELRQGQRVRHGPTPERGTPEPSPGPAATSRHGDALHPDVDGILFTGSYAVGVFSLDYPD